MKTFLKKVRPRTVNNGWHGRGFSFPAPQGLHPKRKSLVTGRDLLRNVSSL